jgi:hypothetical protein
MSRPAHTLPAVEVGSDAEHLAQVFDFIEAHEAKRGSASPATFYLSTTDDRDRVELTGPVRAILRQVVAALSKGQEISILARRPLAANLVEQP